MTTVGGGVGDRYREVGLAGNPFVARAADDDTISESTVDQWFVDRGIPPPPPPGARTLVQLIGDQGLGKSTHLAYWRRLQPGPYHYIPRTPYKARWHRPPVEPLVYGDEIDRMPRALRRRWFADLGRLGATAAIGTHRDLERLGRRFGFEVRTHHLEPANRSELADVLDRRLQASTVEGHTLRFTFTHGELDEILAASAGNLRMADGICHRIMAERLRRPDQTGRDRP